MSLFMVSGVIVPAFFSYCLVSYPVETVAINHHVFYKPDFPRVLIPYAAGFYLTATVVPPMLSKNLKIKLIGSILLGSYIIARIFFQPSIISVWCFFAIAVGLLIYLVMRSETQKHKPHNN